MRQKLQRSSGKSNGAHFIFWECEGTHFPPVNIENYIIVQLIGPGSYLRKGQYPNIETQICMLKEGQDSTIFK